MRPFYIALGFALTLTLNSLLTVAWTSHLEKTITPGNSVTIHCDDETTSIDVEECGGGELVVSPAVCAPALSFE